MFTRKEKESMCKLCEIIGDILPRGKTVTEVLLDRMLVVTHKNLITTPVLPSDRGVGFATEGLC
jgi:hypothetical protein